MKGKALSWINSKRKHNAGINTEFSEQWSCTGMCGIQQSLKEPGEEEGTGRWQTLQAVQNLLRAAKSKKRSGRFARKCHDAR